MGQPEVIMIGLGGLGSIIAKTLCERKIPLLAFDPDEVALHNLHRQILFSETDIGQKKVEVAKRVLGPAFEGVADSFSVENLKNLTCKILVDASDDGYLKLALDEADHPPERMVVIGSALGKEGLVWCRPGDSNYRLNHLFGEANEDFLTLNCSRSGVLGPLVNWVGGQMVQEVLTHLKNPGQYKARFWRISASPLKANCQDFF